jgi:hypothetical protein
MYQTSNTRDSLLKTKHLSMRTSNEKSRNQQTQALAILEFLSIERVRQKIVSLLGGKKVCGESNTSGSQKANNCPGGAEIERRIKRPSRNIKLIIMIIKIGLAWISLHSNTSVADQLTTIEMATNSIREIKVNMPAAKGQPVSRLYFPPHMMTTKVTKPPKHNRVANDARNPTVLHMEQKYRSPP